MFLFLHQLRAIIESVQYIISPTRSPRACFTKKASSVHNNITNNSFLGIVASINFYIGAKIEHDQSPDLSFLPAKITTPPANSAASDKHISRILETHSSFEGIQHLGICISFSSMNVVKISDHLVCSISGIFSSQSNSFKGSIANFI